MMQRPEPLLGHAWHAENNKVASAAGMESSDGRGGGDEVDQAGLAGRNKGSGFSLEMGSCGRGRSNLSNGF